MSKRDELAEEIAGHPIGGSGYYGTSVGTDEAREIADELIAAGYRKPRTITTEAELSALPEGAILMGDFATYQRVFGDWVTLGGPGAVVPTLPATVIYEPEELR